MVCRSLFLLIAVLGCSQAYAQTGAGTGTGTAPPKDKLAKVSVKVIDESGGAIGDAEVPCGRGRPMSLTFEWLYSI